MATILLSQAGSDYIISLCVRLVGTRVESIACTAHSLVVERSLAIVVQTSASLRIYSLRVFPAIHPLYPRHRPIEVANSTGDMISRVLLPCSYVFRPPLGWSRLGVLSQRQWFAPLIRPCHQHYVCCRALVDRLLLFSPHMYEEHKHSIIVFQNKQCLSYDGCTCQYKLQSIFGGWEEPTQNFHCMIFPK